MSRRKNSWELHRYSTTGDSTLGVLLDHKGALVCYTLEDTYREEKIKGETRIPEGTYELELKNYGGFYKRYAKRFSDIGHEGMVQLKDVPNFTHILIHCGNTEEDTRGCILVGSEPLGLMGEKQRLARSVDAYKGMYPHLLKTIKEKGQVTLRIGGLCSC